MDRRSLRGIASRLAPLLLATLLARTAAPYEIRHLESSRVEQRYFVTMTAFVNLPPPEVRRRLTDFDALATLSDAIQESRRLKPDEAGDIIVYTRMRPCVLFVCRTVRVFETVSYPDEWEIVTSVIPARSDLAYGEAHWRLEPEGAGTLLEYRSELEPGFDVFPLIGPAATKYSLKKQARKFLEGLEDGR